MSLACNADSERPRTAALAAADMSCTCTRCRRNWHEAWHQYASLQRTNAASRTHLDLRDQVLQEAQPSGVLDAF